MKFHIITADCGLDCSSDFGAQEKDLTRVFIGQLLLALAISSKGTNYFFKLFSVYLHLTQDFVYLAGLFFDEVYLCRTLTTKPESGENYLVLKGFNKDVDYMDGVLEKLYEWYINPSPLASIFKSNVINSQYYENMFDINTVLTMRRVTSINFLLYRFNNGFYAKKHKEIHEYIKKLVQHYVDYFINFYSIKQLDKSKKLN